MSNWIDLNIKFCGSRDDFDVQEPDYPDYAIGLVKEKFGQTLEEMLDNPVFNEDLYRQAVKFEENLSPVKQYREELNNYYDKLDIFLKQNSFIHSIHNKPGVIIEVIDKDKNINKYLIGHGKTSVLSTTYSGPINNNDMVLRVKELEIDYE